MLTPKICYTAAGFICHEDKVLLVKHTKLGIWLAPGGHIDPDELPHVAAERECMEEVGLKVQAVSGTQYPVVSDSEYVPTPFLVNLHWVCRENFENRVENPDTYTPLPQWKRGCEQHVCFIYAMKLLEKPSLAARDEVETTDMRWFSLEELEKLADVPQGILAESKIALGFFGK